MLFVTDDRCRMHVAGPHHPERPERLVAVVDGIERAGLREVLVPHVPAPAPIEALERVHDPAYVAAVRAFCLTGGGNLDADTGVVPASYEAALLAAGSGLDAIDALRAGRVDAALWAVRPPGHHARPSSVLGSCLVNHNPVSPAHRPRLVKVVHRLRLIIPQYEFISRQSFGPKPQRPLVPLNKPRQIHNGIADFNENLFNGPPMNRRKGKLPRRRCCGKNLCRFRMNSHLSSDGRIKDF